MTDYASPLRLFQPRQFDYGAGSATQVGLWAKTEGFRRILVLTQPVMAAQIDRLGLPGQVTIFDGIHPEPDSENLTAAVAAGAVAQPDLVVGFVGGSVMDVAKLVTVLRGSQTRSLHRQRRSRKCTCLQHEGAEYYFPEGQRRE